MSFNTRVGTDTSALLASSKDTASACPLEAAANRALTPDLLVEVLKVKIIRIIATIIITIMMITMITNIILIAIINKTTPTTIIIK